MARAYDKMPGESDSASDIADYVRVTDGDSDLEDGSPGSSRGNPIQEVIPGPSEHVKSNLLIHEHEDKGPLRRQTSTTSSLVRQLTKIFKPSSSSGPANSRSESVRLASLRPFHQNREYATIDEDDDAETFGVTGVDLSSLAGLGFEAREMNIAVSPAESPFDNQDTAYVSPNEAVPYKPDFNEFRARRRGQLGKGLIDGIRIQRNPTLVHRDPSTRTNVSREEMLHRAKTVRNDCQNLARKHNKIVEVAAIDLTSLGGFDPVRRPTTETIGGLGSARPENAKVYFFPEDPDIPNWKPFSIRGPFILSLTVLALALAGLQEYLCQRSIAEEKRNSGILAFNLVADVSVADFFAWKYLPTMITIIYAVLFSIMDFDIRRLEPYYQLSQPSGSTAAASLNLDHLTMFQYLVPFNAIRLGHWAVALSTIGNIMAATVAPALQNPSFNFVENNDPECVVAKGCPNDTKNYFVRIDAVWSRLLTSTYTLIAIITVVLFLQMRRQSGLLGDPKGIAGIASMATKSHILQDFKGLDIATRGDIHKRLAHRRFVLYKSSIWQGEFDSGSKHVSDADQRLKSPHPPMLRWQASIPFIGYMVVCLVFVPLITLTKLNVIPNKAPWAPILVATILKLWWSTFEADVRLMEPFYQLSKRNARPEDSLTLDYQATVYGFLPFVATFNRHYLVATVGICTILLDVLSVTAGSFSVTADIRNSSIRTGDVSYDDETSVSFLTSLILSVVILTFVILTTVLVYVRRGHPFLPREPSTIASVLAFIFASNMLVDFIDTEHMTSSELERKLKQTGKTYGLGWIRGRDGLPHCAIDEEPMVSKYVHGKPYYQAVTGGPLSAHEALYPV